MHEMFATQQILSLALEQAGKAGASAVTRVNVRIGEWSTFEPTCLEFCFNILSRDTAAQGAELAVETIPVRYSCSDCGEQYHPSGLRTLCPKCSSNRTALASGREVYVDSVEVK